MLTSVFENNLDLTRPFAFSLTLSIARGGLHYSKGESSHHRHLITSQETILGFQNVGCESVSPGEICLVEFPPSDQSFLEIDQSALIDCLPHSIPQVREHSFKPCSSFVLELTYVPLIQTKSQEVHLQGYCYLCFADSDYSYPYHFHYLIVFAFEHVSLPLITFCSCFASDRHYYNRLCYFFKYHLSDSHSSYLHTVERLQG